MNIEYGTTLGKARMVRHGFQLLFVALRSLVISGYVILRMLLLNEWPAHSWTTLGLLWSIQQYATIRSFIFIYGLKERSREK